MGRVQVLEITSTTPSFIRPQQRTGRRRKGELYEQAVHREFEERYPCYLASLWFRFSDSEGSFKWCQPDGLLLDPWRGQITIVEVKYQHTARAYTQLFDIYLPVVLAAFGLDYQISCLEVCRWYDPTISVPQKPALCERPDRAKPSAFNVHILMR